MIREGLSQLHAVEPDEHVIHEDMRDSDDDDDAKCTGRYF